MTSPGTTEIDAVAMQRSMSSRSWPCGAGAIGEAPWRIAGEVLRTYIICEDGQENVWLIDKHAAHERMRFDALKADPGAAHVPAAADAHGGGADRWRTAAAVLEQLDLLEGYGFLCEDFGDGTVLVREVPTYWRWRTLTAALEELAGGLLLNRADPDAARDESAADHGVQIRHQGGHDHRPPPSWRRWCGKVQSGADPVLPHGSPVAVKLRKYEVEKMFKRA
ncbi:MAG: hypothetical protein ACLU38_15820 [Dysosmobacter sp.]